MRNLLRWAETDRAALEQRCHGCFREVREEAFGNPNSRDTWIESCHYEALCPILRTQIRIAGTVYGSTQGILCPCIPLEHSKYHQHALLRQDRLGASAAST